MFGDKKKKSEGAPRRFAKQSSKNYATYNEAKEAHNLFVSKKDTDHRYRVRRRMMGFDVVVYKRLPEKKKEV